MKTAQFFIIPDVIMYLSALEDVLSALQVYPSASQIYMLDSSIFCVGILEKIWGIGILEFGKPTGSPPYRSV